MAHSTTKKIVPVPKEKRTQEYWQRLNEVIDPELHIGLVDLGLIYDVEIRKPKAKSTDQTVAIVYMTLTSPMCPAGPVLILQVEDAMRLLPDIDHVEVQIVWDPPWTSQMIDPDIRDLMGY